MGDGRSAYCAAGPQASWRRPWCRPTRSLLVPEPPHSILDGDPAAYHGAGMSETLGWPLIRARLERELGEAVYDAPVPEFVWHGPLGGDWHVTAQKRLPGQQVTSLTGPSSHWAAGPWTWSCWTDARASPLTPRRRPSRSSRRSWTDSAASLARSGRAGSGLPARVCWCRPPSGFRRPRRGPRRGWSRRLLGRAACWR